MYLVARHVKKLSTKPSIRAEQTKSQSHLIFCESLFLPVTFRQEIRHRGCLGCLFGLMEWAETETIGIDATDFSKMTPDLELVNPPTPPWR